jgi:hypothetical protein
VAARFDAGADAVGTCHPNPNLDCADDCFHFVSLRRGDEYILLSRDYVPPLSGGHADLEILPDLGSLRHPELVAVFT